MRSFVAIAAVLALAGCASSSGVFPMENGSYRISTTAITSFGGAATARQAAIRDATAHCASQGKRMVVTETTNDSQITQGSSDVTFRCVGE